LAQSQFNVTGWVSCLSAAWYFGVLEITTRHESGPVTGDLTTTVVHSSELQINDVKPDHSHRTNTNHEFEVNTGYMLPS